MTAVGACKSFGHAEDPQGLLRARCEVAGHGRDCRVARLNSRGLFVESFVPAITGVPVTVQFRLPNGHQVRAAGVVIHHEFRVGFDVEFANLSKTDRDQISSLVA